MRRCPSRFARKSNPDMTGSMNCFKFRLAALCSALALIFGAGCEKKSAVEQFSQDSKDAVKKTGDSVKDAAGKAKDAVKDTAQKAVDAGKEGVQKATDWATNAASKTATFTTDAAAKVKEGAQKVESTATNIVNDIKQKVQ